MDSKRIFEEAVRQAFAFLADYGFAHISTLDRAPEMSVLYRNRTTSIDVHFEYGSTPWVEIGRIRQSGVTDATPGSSSLELLLKARAPEEPQPEHPIYDVADPELDRILLRKAGELRRFGSDLLRGDFSILPRLGELAEENARRANLDLFGSETGETKEVQDDDETQ